MVSRAVQARLSMVLGRGQMVEFEGVGRVGLTGRGVGGAESVGARLRLARGTRDLVRALLAGQAPVVTEVLGLRLTAGEADPQGREGVTGPVRLAGPVLVGAGPRGGLRGELGGLPLQVWPHPGLAARLARRRPQVVVLLPDRPELGRALQEHVQPWGWEVVLEQEAGRVARALRGLPVSGVVLQAGCPGAAELARNVKCYPEAGPVFVVTVHQEGEDPRRPVGCEVLGDVRLVDPFSEEQLLGQVELELCRPDRRGSDLRTHLELGLPSRSQSLEEACAFVEQLLRRAGLSEEARLDLGVAIREALTNGAQHGNRRDPARQLRLRYQLDSSAVTVTISDEGKGFRHAPLMSRGLEGDLLEAVGEPRAGRGPGGLGVALMRRCVDELQYSRRGNSVTMVKRLGTRDGKR